MVDAGSPQCGSPSQVVMAVGVTAIDDGVAPSKQGHELRQQFFDADGRHHQPDGARRVQLSD
jgi:hypothetical protein